MSVWYTHKLLLKLKLFSQEKFLKLIVTIYGYKTFPKYNKISQATALHQSLISHRRKACVFDTTDLLYDVIRVNSKFCNRKKKINLFLSDKILFDTFVQKINQLHGKQTFGQHAVFRPLWNIQSHYLTLESRGSSLKNVLVCE
jgi:hypothetical protein